MIAKRFLSLILICALSLFICSCGTQPQEDLVDIPDKYLPIGSVVLLEGGAQPVMIFARAVVVETGETKDYTAVLYPQGYLGDDYIFSFNHESIEEVLFLGYISEEEVKVNDYLIETVK